MTTDQELMWAYSKATNLRQRFWILGMGLLGFFFPGLVVHTLMKAFKTGLDDKDILYMLNLTKKTES
jgi:hypothetical protein